MRITNCVDTRVDGRARRPRGFDRTPVGWWRDIVMWYGYRFSAVQYIVHGNCSGFHTYLVSSKYSLACLAGAERKEHEFP